MRAAGVRRIGAAVETLELPTPRALRPDEVLIEVQACGVGNWDELGAGSVLDYRQPDWPERVRELAGGGVDAAANAARDGSSVAVTTVRDGGRLATITSDLPAAERDIAMVAVVVAPDGRRLAGLVELLARGVLTVSVAEQFPFGQAAAALAQARHGAHGSAIVLRPA
ncbi:MAG: zinc-binding dehydrogenase [Streptosporangiaceae bacterium]